MATQTITTLTDDIDGSAAMDTFRFGLDGVSYEVDLNAKNAKKLQDGLSPFVSVARRSAPEAGRRGRTAKAASPAVTRSPSDREHTVAVREWARSQGLAVSDRGRISQSIQDAYEAAH